MSAAGSLWNAHLPELSPGVREAIARDEPMGRHTYLRVGGPADLFTIARDREALAEITRLAQRHGLPLLVLGEGTNVCVSDRGVRGFVVKNACCEARIGATTYADAGHNFMQLFVRTMQAGLAGLEWAVGIPGTVGGALVSNAGAYRGNISDLVLRLDVVEGGERRWAPPDWMEFSYRDSRLRREGGPPAAILGVELAMMPGEKAAIRLKAKEIQMQRIRKQPWQPSAGSFFKNIRDRALAESLPNLPENLRRVGVVPTAFLSEECGLKGFTIGGAGIAERHANFIVNHGHATAADVRAVAQTVKSRVLEKFGLRLEEEVLYTGEWR